MTAVPYTLGRRMRKRSNLRRLDRGRRLGLGRGREYRRRRLVVGIVLFAVSHLTIF